MIRLEMVGLPPKLDATHLLIFPAVTAAVAAFTYRYIEFGGERDWRRLFRPAAD